MGAQILVVEADRASQELIGLNLVHAGHAPVFADDAETALVRLDEAMPDLVLAQWDLPSQSGIALVRRLRAKGRTRDLPFIMLGSRCAEPDTVLALESGADDYLRQPFGPRELLARIQALLRRRVPHLAAGSVQLAGLRLDPSTLRVTAGSRQVALGRVEFRLLNFLMHHPERVHTRAQLLDQVWGNDAILDERTVDAHVGRLRHALQRTGYRAQIETVRGSGYRFAA
ncbi:MAG: winged helix-turn-helix domain-containing protein [Pseudomonadota bacterium]